jgi:8-oxo-dGTP pyrophosphatase MutT (NUDIX family)
MLLEVRGKLRTHSGEVRCAVRLFVAGRSADRYFSFPGGRVDKV